MSSSITVSGTLDSASTHWALPEEVPVAIQLNSQNYAVMMATPEDLEDFATGFLVSEGLVKHHAYIKHVLVMPNDEGFTLDVAIDESNIIRERMVQRNIEGRVGCGLCGVAEMEDAIRMPHHQLPDVKFTTAAIARAFQDLHKHQPMNAINRTVHAAAWCTIDGSIRLAREDVGRHNALDKLIGAMAHQHIETNGFVVMSSRCSFELVQKCAISGIGALATISAPTALAWRLAKKSGLKIAALSKQGVMMFDGEENG